MNKIESVDTIATLDEYYSSTSENEGNDFRKITVDDGSVSSQDSRTRRYNRAKRSWINNSNRKSSHTQSFYERKDNFIRSVDSSAIDDNDDDLYDFESPASSRHQLPTASESNLIDMIEDDDVDIVKHVTEQPKIRKISTSKVVTVGSSLTLADNVENNDHYMGEEVMTGKKGFVDEEYNKRDMKISSKDDDIIGVRPSADEIMIASSMDKGDSNRLNSRYSKISCDDGIKVNDSNDSFKKKPLPRRTEEVPLMDNNPEQLKPNGRTIVACDPDLRTKSNKDITGAAKSIGSVNPSRPPKSPLRSSVKSSYDSNVFYRDKLAEVKNDENKDKVVVTSSAVSRCLHESSSEYAVLTGVIFQGWLEKKTATGLWVKVILQLELDHTINSILVISGSMLFTSLSKTTVCLKHSVMLLKLHGASFH
jgi:hypothetical protein